MQTIAKIISKLMKDTIKGVITLNDLAGYFGLDVTFLSKIMNQKELFDSMEALINNELERKSKLKTNADTKNIITHFSELITKDIHIIKKYDRNVQAQKLRELVNIHHHNVKYFSTEIVPSLIEERLSYDFVNRLLNSKKTSKEKDLEYLSIIQKYFDEKTQKVNENVNLDDVFNYLMNNIETPALSADEIKNLCGTYFYFKRTSYIDANKRLLNISTIEFFKKQGNTVGFKYIRKGRRKNYYVEGNALRDSNHSIKLIGFEYGEKQKYRTIQVWGLSVSVGDLKSGEKMYINGGVFEFESGLEKKPFHTFVHISKIKNAERFYNSLKESSERVDIKGSNFSTLMYTTMIGNFKKNIGKEKTIKMYIGDNHADFKNYQDYVDYIYRKMFLYVKEINED